jgi:hypothetical protein
MINFDVNNASLLKYRAWNWREKSRTKVKFDSETGKLVERLGGNVEVRPVFSRCIFAGNVEVRLVFSRSLYLSAFLSSSLPALAKTVRDAIRPVYTCNFSCDFRCD